MARRAANPALLRAVSGLAPIVAGEVMLEGRAIHRQPPHRGYVIRTGEVFLSGPAEELRRDSRVIEGYLGG